MKFYVRIFDSYHHWDESSSYDHGVYSTYEAAVNDAKRIVREYFEGECKPGKTAGELMADFAMYGEQPVVVPDQPRTGERFSSRAYAEEYVKQLCKKHNK